MYYIFGTNFLICVILLRTVDEMFDNEFTHNQVHQDRVIFTRVLQQDKSRTQVRKRGSLGLFSATMSILLCNDALSSINVSYIFRAENSQTLPLSVMASYVICRLISCLKIYAIFKSVADT